MDYRKKTKILPRNPFLGGLILPPAVIAKQVIRLLRNYPEARVGGRVFLSDRLIERVNDGIESVRMVQQIRRCLERPGRIVRIPSLRPLDLDVPILSQAKARLLASNQDGSAILDEALVTAIEEAIAWAKETDWSLREIQEQPTDAHGFHSRGLAHCALGLHLQAISDFTSAIELLPRRGFLYSTRAKCLHEHMRDYENALIDIGAAIHFHPDQLDPCSAVDYLYRSKILWVCRRHEEAVRSLEAFRCIIEKVFEQTAWNSKGVGYLGDFVQYEARLLKEYLELAIEHAGRLQSIGPRAECVREALARILEQL